MPLRENRLFLSEPDSPEPTSTAGPGGEPEGRWRSWFGSRKAEPAAAAAPNTPADDAPPPRRIRTAFDPLAGVDADTRIRLRRALGFAVGLFAVYLMLALVSHFGNAGRDAALADYGPTPDPMSVGDLAPHNAGGSVGAFVSELLITQGYGLAALLIAPFLGLLAWGIVTNRHWGLVREWGLYLFGALHGASFFLGYWSVVFDAPTMDLAGGVGIALTHWLKFYIGLVGVGLLQAALLGVFLVLRFGAQVDFAALVRTLTRGAVSAAEEPAEPVAPVNTFWGAPAAATNDSPTLITEDEEPVIEGEFTLSLRRDETAAQDGDVPAPSSFYDFGPDELQTEPTLVPRARPSGAGAMGADDLELVIEPPSPDSLAPVVSADNLVATGEDTYVRHMDESDLPTADGADDVGDWTAFDPTLELANYVFPTIDILKEHGTPGGGEVNRAELEANKQRILQTLANYNIQIASIKATIGPTVTLYEIVPAPGVRINKIKGLEDDIALSLSALGIRIIAPMPGKGTIGIEIPNSKPETVSFRSLVATEKFRNSDAELPLAIGRTVSNEVYIADLAKMPHLLVAGATQQGKSVGLNCIIASILYKKHPAYVKFVLVDPKKVELPLYAILEKHFLAKLPGNDDAVITDNRRVVTVLTSLCAEMDQRYDLLKQARVRNLKEYNAKFTERRLNPRMGHKFLPYIVTVIDELADLMMTAGKEVETPLCRLAQLGRAVGFHLVVATQRPSVNVITGIIKANFPARMSYRVTSKIDSRTILDTNGAEQLIGRGDLLLSTGADLLRIQNAFLDTPEVERLVHSISDQQGFSEPYWLPEVKDPQAEDGDDDVTYDDSQLDPLFEESARLVVRTGQGSTSLIQRRLAIGYNRAGRIMDQLERRGICGPASGSKPREVLISDESELERLLVR
jgi:DNA segregation ATPase FtsK/SpoIIIE, S-DNA-T family